LHAFVQLVSGTPPESMDQKESLVAGTFGESGPRKREVKMIEKQVNKQVSSSHIAEKTCASAQS